MREVFLEIGRDPLANFIVPVVEHPDHPREIGRDKALSPGPIRLDRLGLWIEESVGRASVTGVLFAKDFRDARTADRE